MLPEGEIGWVAFAKVFLHPGAGKLIFDLLAGEPAIFGQSGGVEIDIAHHLIGIALFDQAGDQGNDLGDHFRGPGLDGGRPDAQGGAVVQKCPDVFGCNAFEADALIQGLGDDLVLNIGDVLHIGDLISPKLKVAAHYIEEQEGAGVADMEVIIYCGPAGI